MGNKLGRPMHEIRIETNAFLMSRVCHNLIVAQLAVGDPDTGEFKPLQ